MGALPGSSLLSALIVDILFRTGLVPIGANCAAPFLVGVIILLIMKNDLCVYGAIDRLHSLKM